MSAQGRSRKFSHNTRRVWDHTNPGGPVIVTITCDHPKEKLRINGARIEVCSQCGAWREINPDDFNGIEICDGKKVYQFEWEDFKRRLEEY